MMTELKIADIRLIDRCCISMQDILDEAEYAIEDIEYLEKFIKYADDTVGCIIGKLFCGMNSKLKSLKRARDFNTDMVKTLPADVIHLIKEFMVDDIEFVRKAYVIYDILPLYGFLPEVSIGELPDKVKNLVRRINKKKLVLAINNTTHTWVPKNKKREFYVEYITTQFTILFKDFEPKTTLPVNFKENIGRYGYYKYTYDLYRVLQILSG